MQSMRSSTSGYRAPATFTRHVLRATIGSLAVAALATGCSSNANNANKNNALTYNRGVTDVSPSPAVATTAAPQPGAYSSYQSTPSASVSDAAYSTNYTDYSAASPSASVSTGGGQTYIVKKGDTLYKIARDHYGDAKAWHKIAAANPAAAGGAIKVGQKLVLP